MINILALILNIDMSLKPRISDKNDILIFTVKLN